jgi:hypothetical protein
MRLIIALCSLLALLPACRRSQREGTTVSAWRTDPNGRQAISLASSDLSCRASALSVTSEGDGHYVVQGCGHYAHYRCRGGCIRTDGPPPMGYTATAAPSPRVPAAVATAATWPDEVVRGMVVAYNDRAIACFAADHVPATVRIVLSRDGTIGSRALISDASDTERRCLEQLLATVHLDGTYAPRTVVIQFTVVSQEPVPDSSAAGQAEWDIETTIRNAITEQSDRILLCTSGPVAVAVTWTAAGVLEVSLRGRMHGAPEEGCVRQVLAGLHVQATGHAGSLLHPVGP